MTNGKKKNGNGLSREYDYPWAWKDVKSKTEETKKIYDEEDKDYKPKIILTPEKWLITLGLISCYVGFTIGFILRNTLFLLH